VLSRTNKQARGHQTILPQPNSKKELRNGVATSGLHSQTSSYSPLNSLGRLPSCLAAIATKQIQESQSNQLLPSRNQAYSSQSQEEILLLLFPCLSPPSSPSSSSSYHRSPSHPSPTISQLLTMSSPDTTSRSVFFRKEPQATIWTKPLADSAPI